MSYFINRKLEVPEVEKLYEIKPLPSYKSPQYGSFSYRFSRSEYSAKKNKLQGVLNTREGTKKKFDNSPIKPMKLTNTIHPKEWNDSILIEEFGSSKFPGKGKAI